MTVVPSPGRGEFVPAPSTVTPLPPLPANRTTSPRPKRLPAEIRREWPARAPIVIGYLGVVLLLVGFGGWAVMSEINGAVISSGRIEVEQNQQVVQHPDGGIVAEIAAKDGDRVTAGDLLIRLDADELRSELSIVEGQLFEVLARRARFEAERDSAADIVFPPLLTQSPNPVAAELMEGQRKLHEARRTSEDWQREQLQRQHDQLASQIDGLEAQRQALERQIVLLNQEIADQSSLLERGLTQAARVLALQREEANLAGRLGEVAAAVAETESRMTELEVEILKLEIVRREQAISSLRDLQYNEIELAERRNMILTRLDRLDIRAPASGIVHASNVFAQRSVVRAAEPLLYIIPQDRPLVIATRVEPRDIDQIHMGQAVMLRFTSFDQRTTPELKGHVVQVSADAFTDEVSGATYYRAEIALDEGEAAKLPTATHLLPGMPVEAYIATGSRSPLAYLTKPFTDYFARVFREA